MESRSGRPPRASGFTLVELLIVVGIIALLAAVIFPSFASARRQSRMAVCASQLHQIGQATKLYDVDWSGLPSANPWPPHYDPLGRYGIVPSMYLCPEGSQEAAVTYGFRFAIGFLPQSLRDLPIGTRFPKGSLEPYQWRIVPEPNSVLAICGQHALFSTRPYLVLRANGSVERITPGHVVRWAYRNGRWYPPETPIDPEASPDFDFFDVFPSEPWPPHLEKVSP